MLRKKPELALLLGLIGTAVTGGAFDIANGMFRSYIGTPVSVPTNQHHG